MQDPRPWGRFATVLTALCVLTWAYGPSEATAVEHRVGDSRILLLSDLQVPSAAPTTLDPALDFTCTRIGYRGLARQWHPAYDVGMMTLLFGLGHLVAAVITFAVLDDWYREQSSEPCEGAFVCHLGSVVAAATVVASTVPQLFVAGGWLTVSLVFGLTVESKRMHYHLRHGLPMDGVAEAGPSRGGRLGVRVRF